MTIHTAAALAAVTARAEERTINPRMGAIKQAAKAAYKGEIKCQKKC
jgi:hypothetical protein